jgi:DNA-binding NarL/FixJ family response regulator
VKGTTADRCIGLASAKLNDKKKVLVVDDHAIVRKLLSRMIDETDVFSVEGEAEDGNTAIQMAVEGEWDIVLLDYNLPKKNGIEVLVAVKKIKPNLPIIMLSSHSKDEYGEITLSKGAAYYIEKWETDILVEAMCKATLLK